LSKSLFLLCLVFLFYIIFLNFFKTIVWQVLMSRGYHLTSLP